MQNRLFPDWQIDLIADEWLWVKITDTPEGEEADKGGLPVFDLDNTHRRAYEGMSTIALVSKAEQYAKAYWLGDMTRRGQLRRQKCRIAKSSCLYR